MKSKTNKPITDYELKYKYNLNYTQRVLFRIISLLGNKHDNKLIINKK